MGTLRLGLLAVCCSALLGVGCSKEDAAPAAAPSAATTPARAQATAAVPAARKRASACELVTPAEMSAILGKTVAAAVGDNDRPPASTECIYASAAAPGSDAELQVDWGAGDPQVLGQAAGLAQGAAPVGAVTGLEGLGERAYQVTADQVFISTQGNLMMIRFMPGSDDVLAKARRIYETAKARM